MEILSGFERVAIGSWPSPIRELPHASATCGVDIYAKLEDECGAWGGNKVRKLEYLVAAARSDGVTSILCYGVGGSSWVAAAALHARAFDLNVVAAVAGEIPDGYRRLYEATGVRVHRTRRWAALPVALARALFSTPRPARVWPAGGSGGLGDVGSTRAGLEIADQVAAGELPAPAHVFVAAGTGGTAAGIAVGLGAGGLGESEVKAVRVTPRPLGTETLVRRRARRVARVIAGRAHGAEISPAPIVGDDLMAASGYGRPGSQGLEAMAIARSDGLELDPTYGAKAFAALLDRAQAGTRGPFLFLHTSPGPLLEKAWAGA